MLPNTGFFFGKTIMISGASRGIGKEIALKLAKDGANIVIAAKTATAHPKLPGTIYTAAEEIEKAGGKALPCVVDVRDESSVVSAVNEAAKKFGGIDILINNASAISLTPVEKTGMKKYDLMNSVNTRGTYLMSRACLPYLKESSHAHILNNSPPPITDPIWFENHCAYTIAKLGMSLCVLGMSGEFKKYGIGVNAIWPSTAIYTAAIDFAFTAWGITKDNCRKPSIIADAVYVILSKNPRETTGNFFVDEDVLKEEGIKNLDSYAYNPTSRMLPDYFLDRSRDFYEKQKPHESAAQN